MTENRIDTATVTSASRKSQPRPLRLFRAEPLPSQPGPGEVMALGMGARLGIFYSKNDDLPPGPLLPYSS